MLKRKMTKTDILIPTTAYQYIVEEAAKTGKSQGEILLEPFYLMHPQFRPTKAVAVSGDTPHTPAELARLLREFRNYPGYLAAWEVIRSITKKKPAFDTYLKWVDGQTKFFNRNGAPSGNLELLLAMQQIASLLEGKELTEKRVLAATEKVRAKF